MGKYREESGRVPIAECVLRRLYKVKARSLDGEFAVYDGQEGFVGLRVKFGAKFLSREFHWDQGPPFGTVFKLEDTGIDLPGHISLCADPGTVDEVTGKWVSFDKPIADGGRGWYFTETDVASEDIKPVGKSNIELFDWLMEQERASG